MLKANPFSVTGKNENLSMSQNPYQNPIKELRTGNIHVRTEVSKVYQTTNDSKFIEVSLPCLPLRFYLQLLRHIQSREMRLQILVSENRMNWNICS